MHGFFLNLYYLVKKIIKDLFFPHRRTLIRNAIRKYDIFNFKISNYRKPYSIKAQKDLIKKNPFAIGTLNYLFKRPSSDLSSIQLTATKILLGELGVEYIPERLRYILKEYDALTAINIFLHVVKFDYFELLREPKKLFFFREAIDILVENDYLTARINSNDQPIYSAIATHDIEKIEKCIDVLNLIIRAKDFLDKKKDFVFKKYNTDVPQKLRKAINQWEKEKSWEIVLDSFFSEIVDNYKFWEEVQEQYDHCKSFFNDLVNDFSRIYDIKSDLLSFNQVLRVSKKAIKDLLDELIVGKEDPIKTIESLQLMILDCRSLFQLMIELSQNVLNLKSSYNFTKDPLDIKIIFNDLLLRFEELKKKIINNFCLIKKRLHDLKIIISEFRSLLEGIKEEYRDTNGSKREEGNTGRQSSRDYFNKKSSDDDDDDDIGKALKFFSIENDSHWKKLSCKEQRNVVKKKFRQLAKVTHPDTTRKDDSEMQKINENYDILKHYFSKRDVYG